MPEVPLPISTIVDLAIRERELSAVVSVLAHPFTQSSMDKWVNEGPNRYKVFRDAFWGVIRWPKSIGRSASASLADGFSFSLQFHYFKLAVGAGGIPSIEEHWTPLPSPTAWEVEDDADHYRVVYFGYYNEYGQNVDNNELTVKTAGTWTNPSSVARFLLLNPLGYTFGGFGSPQVLGDMTVEQHILEAVPRWSVKL
jgi:hypothetical protein